GGLIVTGAAALAVFVLPDRLVSYPMLAGFVGSARRAAPAASVLAWVGLLLLAALPPRALPARQDPNQPPAAPNRSDRTWRGKWVWTPGEPSPKNPYPWFRQ